MVFCNSENCCFPVIPTEVTILILIDGFLQCYSGAKAWGKITCHNPYFNRWFSAIINRGETMFNFEDVTILILIDGFLQCVGMMNKNQNYN